MRILITNDDGINAPGLEVVAEIAAELAGPEGELPARGTISVIGPGTGLGVAHLWRDGKGYVHVQATDGGSAPWPPQMKAALLRGDHFVVREDMAIAEPDS